MKDLITAYKNFFGAFLVDVAAKEEALLAMIIKETTHTDDEMGNQWRCRIPAVTVGERRHNFKWIGEWAMGYWRTFNPGSPYARLKQLRENISSLLSFNFAEMAWHNGELSVRTLLMATVCDEFAAVVNDLKTKQIVDYDTAEYKSVVATGKEIVANFKKISLADQLSQESDILLAGMFSRIATLKLEGFELTEKFVNQLLTAKEIASGDYRPSNLTVVAVSANEKVIQLLPGLLHPNAKLEVMLDRGKFTVKGNDSKEQKEDLVSSLSINVTEKTSEQISQLLGVLPSGAAKHLTFTQGAFVKGIVLTDVDITVLTISASCMLPTMVKDLSKTLTALSKLQSLCFDSVSFSTDDARAKFFQTILANESKDCSVFNLEKLEFSNCATFSPEEINMFLVYVGKNASLQSLKLNGVDWLPLKKDFDQIYKFVGQDSKDEIKTDSLPTKDELLARQKLLFSLHAKLTNLINIGFPEIKLIAGQPWLKSLQSIFAGWMKFLSQVDNFADVQHCLDKINELVKKFPGATDTLDKHLLEICDKAVEKMVAGDEKAIVSQCKATGAIDVLLKKINLDGGKVLKKYICALRDTSILEMTELSLEHAKKHAPELMPSCLKACMGSLVKAALAETDDRRMLGLLKNKAEIWMGQAKSVSDDKDETQKMCAEGFAKIQSQYNVLLKKRLMAEMSDLVKQVSISTNTNWVMEQLNGKAQRLLEEAQNVQDDTGQTKMVCAIGFNNVQTQYMELLNVELEQEKDIEKATNMYEQAKKIIDDICALTIKIETLRQAINVSAFKAIQDSYGKKIISCYKDSIITTVENIVRINKVKQEDSNTIDAFVRYLNKIPATVAEFQQAFDVFLKKLGKGIGRFSWRGQILDSLRLTFSDLKKKIVIFDDFLEIGSSAETNGEAECKSESSYESFFQALAPVANGREAVSEQLTTLLPVVPHISAEEQKATATKSAIDKMNDELKAKGIIIPDDFICPITHQAMLDPVWAADGVCYERSAIESWIKVKGKNNNGKVVFVSPVRITEFEHVTLIENWQLKSTIKAFLQQPQMNPIQQTVPPQTVVSTTGLQKKSEDESKDEKKATTPASLMTNGSVKGPIFASLQPPKPKSDEEKRIDAQLLAISQAPSASSPLPVLTTVVSHAVAPTPSVQAQHKVQSKVVMTL